MTDITDSATSSGQDDYKVLARKYRPQNFDELIGQDTLVQTLKNAIQSNRIAHAYMLTGVRGVGKTTTARIIAKAINYTGPDGNGQATIGATDDCEICKAIAEDRHPDVMEMDAASRTGVDDIREILDGVKYAPVSARYKVYIIDEVHMLSKQAFNALLKTLEEPPAHVKFIFATTEIRKVPVTVLSRCQRFDLARVPADTLVAHYSNICEKENVTIDDEAMAMIARAADGSVRDGLSLLDQAMALGASDDGTIKIETALVKSMLGLGDRSKTVDLLETSLKGQPSEALAILEELHSKGGDPLLILQDLLALTHTLTRARVLNEEDGNASGANTMLMSKEELARLQELAASLSLPSLARAWQILMKGLSEVQYAANAETALEMVLIRLIYAADLPDPASLIKKLQAGGSTNAVAANTQSSAPASQSVSASHSGSATQNTMAALAPQPQAEENTVRALNSLEDIIALLEEHKEMQLAANVHHYVRLISIRPGKLEIGIADHCPPDFFHAFNKALNTHSGARWMIVINENAAGGETLAEAQQKLDAANMQKALDSPAIKEILASFPEAKIIKLYNPNEEETE